MNTNLSDLRQQIDTLDIEIIHKIQERAKVAEKIGELKRVKGEPIYRPDREQEVYQKVKRLNKGLGPLPDRTLSSIYREIMSGSISIEKGHVIAYLGPEGSFSHQATRRKFGDSIELMALNSIPEIFRSVEAGKADYGVVPIENSSEGLVDSTLDTFLYSDTMIYAETYMRISLHLLGFERDFQKIKTIHGIKIANSQCKNWLVKNLPNREIIETSSTAKAAKIVSEQHRKDGVAIASALAADIYGLEILSESIEDMPNNSTRFLIIGSDTQCEPTGNDKTSIIFSVSDRPGSLYSVLQLFHNRKLNLTKIESRPTRKNSWEYNFFVDFIGHRKEPKISELIEELKEKTMILKIMGSYPISESTF
ncbi:MAG: prephenate dehydratase [Spirochaetota bacterium]